MLISQSALQFLRRRKCKQHIQSLNFVQFCRVSGAYDGRQDPEAPVLVCALDSNALSIASFTILILLGVTGGLSSYYCMSLPPPNSCLFFFFFLQDLLKGGLMTFSEYFYSITVGLQSVNYNLCAKSGLPPFFEVLLEHNHPYSFMPYDCRVGQL